MQIRPADHVSLEETADHYGRWRNAKAAVPLGGFFVCEKTGNPKRHPAAVEALQAAKELRLMMEANGLNMVGWSRFSREGRGNDEDDEFFGPMPVE